MNHTGNVLAVREGLTVIDCAECGYAHLAAIPTAENLARFYSVDFWQKEKAGALADFEREAEWWEAVHGDWLSIIEAHTSGRNLLDIGSGYGFFLLAAMMRHWRTHGVDLNTDAIDYCEKNLGKGVVTRASWETFFTLENFDAITAHWFIEHIPDPLRFLRACKTHLAPGGVLMLAVPQEWTKAQAHANAATPNKCWWVHHTHVNYFTLDSLTALLDRAGFEVVDALASAQIETRIGAGLDYTLAPALGRKIHAHIARAELEIGPTERVNIGRALAQARMGRDMMLFAKVKP